MMDFTGILLQGSSLPLYEQLYRGLAGAVRSGQLAAGEKLPGKRSLAGQLGISVNTVDAAYQLLAAEGYLESRPRSGYYVLAVEGLHAPPPQPAADPPEPAPAKWRFDLGTGGVDRELFPFRTWGRIQKELLYSQPQLLERGDGQGDAELRAVLADHLRQYRGVRCRPRQVVIGAGIEYLLGLLARLLGEQAVLAVEDPGYSRAGRVCANEGVPCRPVAIDAGGLSVGALAASGATAAYVTPSHQFPSGVTMPAGRRAALLAWAAAGPGRFIIEDDYDSEFRFDTRPLPSLQGMDQSGRVVYVSTFSKSLAPSIRIACMVLPDCLLQPWRERYGGYACTVSRFEQQTLCRFIAQGHLARHLARQRGAYRQRMEEFRRQLAARLGPGVKIRGQHTGLHLLLEFEGRREQSLLDAARGEGIRISGLGEYCVAARPGPATLLAGYGALPPADIAPAAEALARAVERAE